MTDDRWPRLHDEAEMDQRPATAEYVRARTRAELNHPEADDDAMIARAHAAIEAEIAAEEMDDQPEAQALASLHSRFLIWLGDQPDVADVEAVGDGIFGFRLAGTRGVSAALNLTQ